jgi:hypothetical protein
MMLGVAARRTITESQCSPLLEAATSKFFVRYRSMPVRSGKRFRLKAMECHAAVQPTKGPPAALTSAAGGRPSSQLILSGLGSMFALSDSQFATVITAASKLPTEKRGVFLERVVARLSLSARFTATEFADTVHSALRGLIQEKSAA